MVGEKKRRSREKRSKGDKTQSTAAREEEERRPSTQQLSRKRGTRCSRRLDGRRTIEECRSVVRHSIKDGQEISAWKTAK